MTPDHAAAMAVLDRITPGPYRTHGYNVIRIESDGDPKVITEACSAKKRGGVRGATPINSDHYLPTHDEALANARAIAALPELAEAWRKGMAYREAEHDYVAAAEAEDADYDPLKVGDMRARLHAAAAAFDAALAAVAAKLGEGK